MQNLLPELVQHISRYLIGKSRVALSQTCKNLQTCLQDVYFLVKYCTDDEIVRYVFHFPDQVDHVHERLVYHKRIWPQIKRDKKLPPHKDIWAIMNGILTLGDYPVDEITASKDGQVIISQITSEFETFWGLSTDGGTEWKNFPESPQVIEQWGEGEEREQWVSMHIDSFSNQVAAVSTDNDVYFLDKSEWVHVGHFSSYPQIIGYTHGIFFGSGFASANLFWLHEGKACKFSVDHRIIRANVQKNSFAAIVSKDSALLYEIVGDNVIETEMSVDEIVAKGFVKDIDPKYKYSPSKTFMVLVEEKELRVKHHQSRYGRVYKRVIPRSVIQVNDKGVVVESWYETERGELGSYSFRAARLCIHHPIRGHLYYNDFASVELSDDVVTVVGTEGRYRNSICQIII